MTRRSVPRYRKLAVASLAMALSGLSAVCWVGATPAQASSGCADSYLFTSPDFITVGASSGGTKATFTVQTFDEDCVPVKWDISTRLFTVTNSKPTILFNGHGGVRLANKDADLIDATVRATFADGTTVRDPDGFVILQRAVRLTANSSNRQMTVKAQAADWANHRWADIPDYEGKIVLQQAYGPKPDWYTYATRELYTAASVTFTGLPKGQYRALHRNGVDTADATSNAVTVTSIAKVKTELRFTASPKSISKGKKINAKGSLRRGGKLVRGYKIQLQFKPSKGAKFSTVSTTTTTKAGTFTRTISSSRGSGYWRAHYQGTPYTAASTSSTVFVKVKGNKPKPKPKPTVRRYANCTAMHHDYPHGVGRSGARDRTSGTPVTNFYRSTAIYNANTKSDRDKDGIACEAR